MSILNVFITPEVGLIGVDTEGVYRDGSIVEFGKMMSVHAAGAVIAFRGTSFVFEAAGCISCFGGTVEELAKAIPDLLKRCVNFCRQHQAAEEDLALEMAMVGYSQAEGCVVGYLFTRQAGCEDIREDRIHSRYRAPFWSEGGIPEGIPADRTGMEILARHQSRLSRERAPEEAAGGRFFMAEVRQHSISIEKAFDFPRRDRAA
ncbi:hypothetical protein D3C84_351410 [compost metagenome]